MIFMRVLCTDEVVKDMAKFFVRTLSVEFAKVILNKWPRTHVGRCVESGGHYFEKEPKACSTEERNSDE